MSQGFLGDVGARACPEDASVILLKKIASSGEHNCLSRNQESSTVRVALFVGSLTLVLERTQTAVARIG